MRMKFFLKYILLLIMLFTTQLIYSQRFKFTADTSYVRELNDFISKTNRKELKQSFITFSSQWNSDSIPITEKKHIVNISNRLLKKRAAPYPYFNDFMKMISSVLKSENQSIKLSNIINIFNKYTENLKFTNRNIDNIFKTIILVVDSNSFYESKALKWKFNSNKYNIERNTKNKISFVFDKTDLICYAKRDSLQITNTSGKFYPEKVKWQGKGGKVNWERANFSPDSVFADLDNYSINMKLSQYNADSVNFTNKIYLSRKLLGKFEDKILPNARGSKAKYPKFYAYDKSIEIAKVVPNIDYIGGFNMIGARFVGVGDEFTDAKLFIYKDDELFTKASSNAISFDKKRISANNTKISIGIKEDSLYHPGLDFNYIIAEKKLALTRTGGGLSESSFFDTYHKLDINAKELSFKLTDSILSFKALPATIHRNAYFESTNYFSSQNYDRVGLRDKIHPLYAIRRLSGSDGNNIITSKRLSRYLRKPESQCISLLIRLANSGFIDYNIETKEAKAKQKVFDYINANSGKKDYDAIKISSNPKRGNNASLNLNNMDLTIHSIKPFALSNSRRVAVIPDSSEIIIKKDLEFTFNGKLQAGLARIYGRDLTFYYDSFFVSLSDVDSLTLAYRSDEKVEVINQNNQKDSTYLYYPVMSTIEKITGLLRIDEPQNKSGQTEIPEYPIIESHDTSYVYYEKRSKNDTTSIYKKESFYFKNYPFEIDSLNTIVKTNIDIKGLFNSGGIFPSFEENLTVQNDSSLGFIHDLDEDEEAPLYGGRAKYKKAISLSNEGLKGSGKIDYLNSSIFSKEFIFFPDSMNAYTNIIEMKKTKEDSIKTEYPEVNIDSAYVHWEPTKDRMFIKSLKDSFAMYKTYAEFRGELELTPDYLKGKGDVDLKNAHLKSESFTFLADNFTVDTANFDLKPREFDEISPVLTYNVSGNIDFIKKEGAFKSTGDSSYINFQINQYLCYINFFNWYMREKTIEIGANANITNDTIITNVNQTDSVPTNQIVETTYTVELSDTTYSDFELTQSSRFVSTHENQDSLNFIARTSSYDIEKSIIKARNVKVIKVGDAHIFPRHSIIIEPYAKMRTLEQSRIVANTISRFHEFYDASINVYGAKAYSANGDYHYFNKNDSMQIIRFDSIYINKSLEQTLAEGYIPKNDSLRLSPEFSYYGDMSLEAKRKDIEFKGYANMNIECTHRIKNSWFKFESIINKDSIVIPIDSVLVDDQNKELYASLLFTQDSLGVYTSFLNSKKRFTDKAIISSKGYLYYNEKTGYFEITDSAKLVNPDIEGNYLSIHKKLCLVIGEGKLDFGITFGQVKLNTVGKISQNLENFKSSMEVMMGVDFYFSQEALTFMANKFNETQFSEPIDTEKKVYQSNFTELVGYKRAERYSNNIALTGLFSTLPAEMNHNIFFTDIKFKWNRKRRAYVSEGQIGIGNINNHQINKLVDGKIEILHKKNGNVLTIYLAIDQFNWFFFTYKNETMKSVSSFDDFNLIIANLKDKERKSPVKNLDFEYSFNKGKKETKDRFLEKFKNEEEDNFNFDNYTTKEKNTETNTEENNEINNEESGEIQELETEEIIETEEKGETELETNEEEEEEEEE